LSEEYLADTIPRNNRVAAVTTTSLRTLLDLFPVSDTFPYGITHIVAGASVTHDKGRYFENRDYGTSGYDNRLGGGFNLDHRVDFDQGDPVHPIDEYGRKGILNILEMSGSEDAPVSLVEVIIKAPDIAELCEIPRKEGRDLFFVYLPSDRVDGEADQNAVKEHSVNEGLIKDSGFQYRLLNCRKMIDRFQQLTLPGSQQEPQINWRGETPISLRSPIRVAQTLAPYFGEFGWIKQYGVGERQELVLLGGHRPMGRD